MPFIPHTAEETTAMLDVVGVRTLDDLFASIGSSLRPQRFDLAPGLSEMEVLGQLSQLAANNAPAGQVFLGAGFYDHHVPSAIDALVERGEFLTAYTPYQPEVAQGTLQAIFEYQTAVCRLLEMDVANASVYDGGSALFEATMMAVRQTKRRRIVIDEAVNPIWRAMLACHTGNLDLDLAVVPQVNGVSDKAALMAAVSDPAHPCAGVIVQNPNFFGAVDDYTELFAAAKAAKALGVISVYPVMQSVLKTPGEMGADIAVADGQSLGLPLSSGGPYLGIMTCTKALVRQMPGRIVGRTSDKEDRTGYVLTIQAREQHIRRNKATSNICSNQALCALRALIHMALLGPEGLERTAAIGMGNARAAAAALTALPGVELLNTAPFGNEFAVTLPVNAAAVVDRLAAAGFVPGFPMGRYYSGMDTVLLVACTEKHDRDAIARMAETLGAALAGGK